MAEDAGRRTAARGRWLRLNGPAVVALVVIGAQVLWRAVILAGGYFSQDDFLAISAAAGEDLSSALTGDYAGGFSPGGSLLVRASVALAPLNWTFAIVLVLVLQTAATVMLWLVLGQLLGDRWLKVPLLVMFAFSTLTLWSTQWWVLALEFWSATLLVLIATWFVVAAVGDPRRNGRTATIIALVALTGAVLFDERAVLAPVLVLGLLLVVDDAETLRSRLGRVLGLHQLLAVGSLLVLLGYAVLRWQIAPISLDLGDDLGEVVTSYVRHAVVEVFGGPWTGSLPAHAYLVPVSWAVAANGLLLLALVGATLQHGGVAARAAWGTLLVVGGGSVGVLVLTGRADLAGSLGLVHRTAAELALPLVLCIAGAVRGVSFPDLTARGRWWTSVGVERSVSVLAATALTVATAISTPFLAANLRHTDDRSYVETLRAALRAEPQVVLLDAGVPAGVISAWYGERARVSTVLAAAPERPVFDLPSHSLRAVREDGSLAQVQLGGPVLSVPSADVDCGYPVRASGTLIPMQAVVPDGRWVLRVGYYTSADAFAEIDVAGSRQRFAVRSGLNVLDLVVLGSFVNFRMTLDAPDAALCLTDASAGVPVAAAEGPARSPE